MPKANELVRFAEVTPSFGKTCANIKFAASLQTKSAKSKHDVNVIRRMPGRFLTFAVLKKKSTLL